MTATIIYNGKLRTTATHLHSGNSIETDAPIDNQGLAERFSPTDLVATALGSCMLTIMGIAARNHSIDIDGTRVEIEKIMESNPRRIGEIKVTFTFNTLQNYDDKQRKLLENAAMTCPVFYTLSDQVIKTVTFNW